MSTAVAGGGAVVTVYNFHELVPEMCGIDFADPSTGKIDGWHPADFFSVAVVEVESLGVRYPDERCFIVPIHEDKTEVVIRTLPFPADSVTRTEVIVHHHFEVQFTAYVPRSIHPYRARSAYCRAELLLLLWLLLILRGANQLLQIWKGCLL